MMSNQMALLIMLLLLSTAFGLYRKRTEGRIKITSAASPQSQVQPDSTESRQPTQRREAATMTSPEVRSFAPKLKFGRALGTDVTLVQFSSAFCQPCRATRLLLEDVAASTPGVAHIEIDAEAHLDLVREMGVTRTPTTFILNGRGEIVGKSVGLPKRVEVMNVVQAVAANA